MSSTDNLTTNHHPQIGNSCKMDYYTNASDEVILKYDENPHSDTFLLFILHLIIDKIIKTVDSQNVGDTSKCMCLTIPWLTNQTSCAHKNLHLNVFFSLQNSAFCKNLCHIFGLLDRNCLFVLSPLVGYIAWMQVSLKFLLLVPFILKRKCSYEYSTIRRYCSYK